jgi:hypothetical protein
LRKLGAGNKYTTMCELCEDAGVHSKATAIKATRARNDTEAHRQIREVYDALTEDEQAALVQKIYGAAALKLQQHHAAAAGGAGAGDSDSDADPDAIEDLEGQGAPPESTAQELFNARWPPLHVPVPLAQPAPATTADEPAADPAAAPAAAPTARPAAEAELARQVEDLQGQVRELLTEDGELQDRLVRGLEAEQHTQLSEFQARFGENDAWEEMSTMLTTQHARATGDLEGQFR